MPEPGGLVVFGVPEHHIPKEPIRRGVKKLKQAESIIQVLRLFVVVNMSIRLILIGS